MPGTFFCLTEHTGIVVADHFADVGKMIEIRRLKTILVKLTRLYYNTI